MLWRSATKSKLMLEIKEEIKVIQNPLIKEILVRIMFKLFKFLINIILKKTWIFKIFKNKNKVYKKVWSILKIQICQIRICSVKMRLFKANILKAIKIKILIKIYLQLIAKIHRLIQLPRLDSWKKIQINLLRMGSINNLV